MKCPNCEGLTELDGKSCSCGWKARSADKPKQARLCEFDDHGQPCGYPGHLSTGTLGTGPWYCRTHFARVMGWPAVEASAVREKPLSIAVEELTAGLQEPYRTRALEAQAKSRADREVYSGPIEAKTWQQIT